LGGGLGFIKAYGAVSPLFNRAPIFYYFYTIAIPTIALLGFGIYAGIGLWTLKPHADKVAKRYLWSLLAWKAILLLLPTFFSLPQKLMSLGAAPISFTNIALGEGGFRIDLSPIFWLLYFNKSARVKETYHIRAKLKDLH
jgi:hypothetical protein